MTFHTAPVLDNITNKFIIYLYLHLLYSKFIIIIDHLFAPIMTLKKQTCTMRTQQSRTARLTI